MLCDISIKYIFWLKNSIIKLITITKTNYFKKSIIIYVIC